MLKRFPESLRARQAIPPIFVSSLLLLFIGAFLWNPVRWILLLEVVLYWVMLLFAGIKSAIKDNEIMHLISVPITIITVHISWGSAFLFSFFENFLFEKE